MLNIHRKAFMDLLPTVAHQEWYIDEFDMIRNERRQCPICAIVEQINPKIALRCDAEEAISVLVGEPLASHHLAEIRAFTNAADNDRGHDVDLRAQIISALSAFDLTEA